MVSGSKVTRLVGSGRRSRSPAGWGRVWVALAVGDDRRIGIADRKIGGDSVDQRGRFCPHHRHERVLDDCFDGLLGVVFIAVVRSELVNEEIANLNWQLGDLPVGGHSQ